MIGAIYVITDPAPQLSILDQARAAAKGGAWAVQLRHKTASDADMLDLALKLRPELSTRGVKLIINDRVDVALRAGADGIHIGQGDGDPNDVRARGSGLRCYWDYLSKHWRRRAWSHRV